MKNYLITHEKLEQLFKLEQLQFYRETEPMVIEQV